MARSCISTWKLSIFVLSKITRNRPLYLRCRSHLHVPSLRTCASLAKNLDAAETYVETDSDSDAEEQQKLADLTDVKLQILKAGLDFVPEQGWSKQSIALGAQSLGLSSSSHTLIEDGGADLVHYFNILCNEKLESYLKEQYSENKTKIDIQNFIEDALENRLKMIIPLVSKWPEAMALTISPLQVPTDSKNLLDLVDMIWSLSGDKSLNLTWYSKRLSLAAIYRMCELSLLQDKSPDYIDTFDFLHRRVEDVMKTSKFIDGVADSTKHLPDVSTGTLITARNILGLNRWFR